MTQHSDSSLQEKVKTLRVRSTAFLSGGFIPQRYTRDGENVNPPLSISDIPEETKSLAVIVEDPDAPGKTWVHWITWNIFPKGTIEEHHAPGFEGKNDFGNIRYDGPAPPSGKHNYSFKVYALDNTLKLERGAGIKELEKTMAPHIIAFGELSGVYGRGL